MASMCQHACVYSCTLNGFIIIHIFYKKPLINLLPPLFIAFNGPRPVANLQIQFLGQNLTLMSSGQKNEACVARIRSVR